MSDDVQATGPALRSRAQVVRLEVVVPEAPAGPAEEQLACARVPTPNGSQRRTRPARRAGCSFPGHREDQLKKTFVRRWIEKLEATAAAAAFAEEGEAETARKLIEERAEDDEPGVRLVPNAPPHLAPSPTRSRA